MESIFSIKSQISINKEKLIEMVEILSDESIDRILLGFNSGMYENLKSLIPVIKPALDKTIQEFENLFQKEITLEEMKHFSSDTEAKLKLRFIKEKDIEKSQPHFTLEALLTMVKFPDLSPFIESLSEFNFAQRNFLQSDICDLVSIDTILETDSDQIVKELDSEIQEICKIYLTGRERVEAYLAVQLFYYSSNVFLNSYKKSSFSEIAGLLKRHSISMSRDFKPDLEKLKSFVEKNL